VTLKREYVKPVIRLLEPGYAEAVTPVLSVTLSQPEGNEFKVGGGGTFTVGVWKIQVPISQLADIPPGGDVIVGVGYTFEGADGIVSGAGAGMPPGSETYIIEDTFVTGPGEFRLTMSVGPWGTSSLCDGQGNDCLFDPVDHPFINEACDELACAPPDGAPNDACTVKFRPITATSHVLGVLLPTTPLEEVSAMLYGAMQ